MLPSRILVATDGSPSAKVAEAFAAEMAVAERASNLAVVTVIVESPEHPGAVSVTDAEYEAGNKLVEAAAVHIRKVMGVDSIPVEALVLRSSSAASAIIGEAHATGTCSHIVLGDRGHGEIANLLLGSTSHQVIQAAHCPVTVVRA